MPVLGMFRKDLDTLADDLSGFIHRVFCGNGFPIAGDKILKGDGGGLGDAALLCFSPAEDKGDRLPCAPSWPHVALSGAIAKINWEIK
jgi:ATP-dependent DNA helicase UvrD/PcrA